ncbi:MAG TPA: PAS domain-containing protein, partial [Tepidisphaeraceae bacterium]|nr:PAS domain-containing protein [Tepidisphaeraceae bacterium]
MQSLFALLLTCIVFLVAFIVFTRRRGTHQRANLQLLVEALPDPVLLIESDNRIVLVNGPTEQLLKIPPQQLIGKKFQDAIRDEALLELFADVAKNPVPNEP